MTRQRNQWEESFDEAYKKLHEASRTVDSLRREIETLKRNLVQAQDENHEALERESRLLHQNHALQQRTCSPGDEILPGEDIPTKDLIRVLREEIACHAAELEDAQTALVAAFTLLRPHMGGRL